MAELVQTTGPRNGTSPLRITVTELGTVEYETGYAHFNGTGAGGSFLPALTVRAQDGSILSRSFATTEVAAGESADVSWFPGAVEEAVATPNPAAGGFNAMAEAFGLIAWTFDPITASNTVRYAGNIVLDPVILATGDVVSTFWLYVVATEVTPPTHAYMAMYDNTFTRVAASADTVTLGNTTGWQSAAASAAYTATYDGAYYIGPVFDPVANSPTVIGRLWNAGSPPTIAASGLYRSPSGASAATPPATFTPTSGAADGLLAAVS